jgi:hypothetical protein
MNKEDTTLLINKELTRVGIPLEHEHASYFRDGYLFAQKQALTIPVVIDTLVCDCEIPKPKSPFIGDYEYDYCRDCDGHISQTNYL